MGAAGGGGGGGGGGGESNTHGKNRSSFCGFWPRSQPYFNQIMLNV
jgi:hypothetical protein